MTRLSVDIDPEVHRRLRLLAVGQGRTVSAIVRDLVAEVAGRPPEQALTPSGWLPKPSEPASNAPEHARKGNE